MGTTVDYIEYVCEQIQGAGAIRYKKMFGEYMVYVNDKPLLLVCDNTVFVKMHPVLESAMVHASIGTPYTGAKSHYILDIDDPEKSKDVIALLEPEISVPKPKKKKGASSPASEE